MAFWIPVVVFTIWLFLITAMVLRAISQQEREQKAKGAPAGSPAVLTS